MEARLQKERTEEVVGAAREQLADERVQEKLGRRGKALQLVAGMMRVPDIDNGYLIEFPEYATKDIFPVVSIAKGDRLVSTMTTRMPIQQEVIRERAGRQWDDEGYAYTEEHIQKLLQMPMNGTLRIDYAQHRNGFHLPYRNVVLHQYDDQAPQMVQVGRPHIALQSSFGPRIKDEVSTLVHELSHAVDAVVEPVVFMQFDPESRELQLSRLRGELAAYATQSVVRRVFRSKSDAVLDFLSPKLCDVVESHRRRSNGEYTSELAFDPCWKVEKSLGAAGLKHIYWSND